MTVHSNVRCRRWLRVSRLVQKCERLLEAAARLDAYADVEQPGATGPKLVDYGSHLGQQLDVLSDRVGHMLDQLTAELLRHELQRKQQLDSETQPRVDSVA